MNKKDTAKIQYIYFFFACLFALLALRIAYLQIFKREYFRKLGQIQSYRIVPFSGRRGKIFDREGRILAEGLHSYSVYADPALIADPSMCAQELAQVLGLDQELLAQRLSKKKRFVWVARKIPWDLKEKVRIFNLKGVGFIREEKRFYPQGDLAGSVLGIVDIDNRGLEGVELFYDEYLRGKNGSVRVLRDSASRDVILEPQVLSPQEGANLYLTIDGQIQYWAQKYLQEALQEYSAKEGSVVVMDATNGEILALANYPLFDPNDVGATPVGSRRNRAICDMFEPGSVFKVVTLLAALDRNTYTLQDTFFCERGRYKIPGSYLHDWHPYAELTFKQVFQKSSNIGVGKIAEGVGRSALYGYIMRLGFGSKTGIDLPGEVNGSVKPLRQWSKTSDYIIPIGQEIGVTLMQLVRAFAAIVNGGSLVTPHVVKEISVFSAPKEVSSEKRDVLSACTTDAARDILVGVVQEGTGKRAQVQGVRVGGKTGTAQKYDPAIGKYSPHRYRASFVGFIDDSKRPLVIGVTIDEPVKSHFGGVVAAPVFANVANRIVKYLLLDTALVRDEDKRNFPIAERH